MTQNDNIHDFDDSNSPLDEAVRSVLAEPVPGEAVDRVKMSAKRLAVVPVGTAIVKNNKRPAKRRRVMVWTAVVGGIALALMAALLLYPRDSAVAWADEMAKALREKPWIHVTTTRRPADRTEPSTEESWFSPADGIATVTWSDNDNARFVDYAKDIAFKYDAEKNRILRVMTVRDELRLEKLSGNFFDRLMNKAGDRKDLFRGSRVVIAQRHEIKVDDRPMIEYLVQLERIRNEAIGKTLRILVDPMTGLPVTWTERYANGGSEVHQFEYPDQGPTSIYDLGVPKTADVIDRVPGADLARIAKIQRVDRQRFDDYDAIVVWPADSEEDWRPFPGFPKGTLSLNRVRRSGDQYRVDQIFSAKPGLPEIPEDVDWDDWWEVHRDDYWSVPLLICDGEKCVHYEMLDDRVDPGEKPNLTVYESMTSSVSQSSEPRVEWPHLMPEYACRPRTWYPAPNHVLNLESNPDDGPEESVRLLVTKPEKGGSAVMLAQWSGTLYRYWFDPDREYVLQKGISTVFDSRTNKAHHTTTLEFDDYAQSPSGIWYPKTVRRTTSESEGKAVRRYYVEFDVDFSEGLFELLDLK